MPAVFLVGIMRPIVRHPLRHRNIPLYRLENDLAELVINHDRKEIGILLQHGLQTWRQGLQLRQGKTKVHARFDQMMQILGWNQHARYGDLRMSAPEVGLVEIGRQRQTDGQNERNGKGQGEGERQAPVARSRLE